MGRWSAPHVVDFKNFYKRKIKSGRNHFRQLKTILVSMLRPEKSSRASILPSCHPYNKDLVDRWFWQLCPRRMMESSIYCPSRIVLYCQKTKKKKVGVERRGKKKRQSATKLKCFKPGYQCPPCVSVILAWKCMRSLHVMKSGKSHSETQKICLYAVLPLNPLVFGGLLNS